MSNFTDDDLAVPDFENALWASLSEAHDDRRIGATHAARPSDRHHRRVHRLVLTGIGSVAAAATLVVALSLRDDEAPTSTRPDQVTKFQEAQEVASASMIVHETRDGNAWTTGLGFGVEDLWIDEVSGAARSLTSSESGKPLVDRYPTSTPGDSPTDRRGTIVDHCRREYVEGWADITGEPGVSRAQDMERYVGWGEYVVDGTEVIDGVELLRFAAVDGPTGERTDGAMWVDPDTYRPVRYRLRGSDDVITIEYLERTPENLAAMSPPPPAGYTQLTEQPPGRTGWGVQPC